MGLFSASDVSIDAVKKAYASVLVEGEDVLLAFKNLRDTVFFTNFRLVIANAQGITGKKISSLSVPWRSVIRFAVETAGTFDLEADLKVWIAGQDDAIEIKISRSSDPAAIQRLFAQYVLGRGQ